MNLRLTLCALALCMGAISAAEAAKQRLCVWDPLGASGQGYNEAKDYALRAQKHGVDFELKAFIDERVAVEDFRTGQCEAVIATALRTRQFNALSAALDSVGSATILRKGKYDQAATYDVVRRFVQAMSSPKAASLMVSGGYEVGGMVPLGAAYAFVNDRSISTLEAAAGKRVAAFDHDKAQAELLQRVGARPVSADITTFGTMFNNGNVDVVVAPAVAYRPFELHKGLGTKGGVARFPLIIVTYQLILRADKFPAGFGQVSRNLWLESFEGVLKLMIEAEKDIPAKYWFEPNGPDGERYLALMREGRIDMAEKGLYDKRGLKLIKKIRCGVNPEASDCAQQTENW